MHDHATYHIFTRSLWRERRPWACPEAKARLMATRSTATMGAANFSPRSLRYMLRSTSFWLLCPFWERILWAKNFSTICHGLGAIEPYFVIFPADAMGLWKVSGFSRRQGRHGWAKWHSSGDVLHAASTGAWFVFDACWWAPSGPTGAVIEMVQCWKVFSFVVGGFQMVAVFSIRTYVRWRSLITLTVIFLEMETTNQILPGGWLETARDCAACFSFQLRFSPDTGLATEWCHWSESQYMSTPIQHRVYPSVIRHGTGNP